MDVEPPQFSLVSMLQRLAPILYAIEFLLALMASFTLWSHAGGQYHLDLMPWYWKFALPLAASYVFTRLTMSWADPDAGKRRAAKWIVLLLAIIACAATVTYYYHLYEPQESDESTDETTSLRRQPSEFHAV